MSSLPVISGKQCVKALKKLDFAVHSQKGSHIILVRKQPKTRLSVPNHKELDRGTLRSIISSTGLTVDEFITLL
ncbi:MAG: type II toxin-antitoxin system HicA family toxin [Microcystaceae cyanobacterium]